MKLKEKAAHEYHKNMKIQNSLVKVSTQSNSEYSNTVMIVLKFLIFSVKAKIRQTIKNNKSCSNLLIC